MQKRRTLFHIICVITAWMLMVVEIIAGTRIVDLYYYHYGNGRNPEKTIKTSIGLKLPKSAEILEYQYSKDGYYNAKVKIEKKDISAVKRQLLQFFSHEYACFEEIAQGRYMPNFENTCHWWDLQNCDVKSAYCKGFVSHGPRGKIPRWGRMYGRGCDWVFISKAEEETYYMYISGVLTVKYLEDYFN